MKKLSKVRVEVFIKGKSCKHIQGMVWGGSSVGLRDLFSPVLKVTGYPGAKSARCDLSCVIPAGAINGTEITFETALPEDGFIRIRDLSCVDMLHLDGV